MSLLSRIASAVRPVSLALHGDQFTVQYSGFDAFPIQAIRRPRNVPEGSDAPGAPYERLLTTRPQFASAPRLPIPGDSVTIGDVSYVVHAVHPDKDPESDLLSIYVARADSTSALWSTPVAP